MNKKTNARQLKLLVLSFTSIDVCRTLITRTLKKGLSKNNSFVMETHFNKSTIKAAHCMCTL